MEDHHRFQLAWQLPEGLGEPRSQVGSLGIQGRAVLRRCREWELRCASAGQVLAPVEGRIDEQPVEPRPEWAARPQRIYAFQRAQQRVLHEVLGILSVLQEPIGHSECLVRISIDQVSKGFRVALTHSLDELRFVSDRLGAFARGGHGPHQFNT